MEKQNVKKVNIILIVLLVAAAAVAITFCVLFSVSDARKKEYATALENAYEKSFYEVNNLIQGLEVKVDKVIVSNDKSMQRTTLNDIWRDCNLASSSLSGIPIDVTSQASTLKFLNQLGGYSLTLSDKVASKNLSDEELNTLADLQKHCVSLKRAFNEAALKISANGFKIVENLKITNGTNNFEESFSDLKNNENTPPELIYDGPYSESLSDKEIKGLPEITYTESDVEKELPKMFKDESIKSITFNGYVDGDFQAYNHTLELNNGEKIVTTVAKRGMFLLAFSRLNTSGSVLEDDQKTDAELMKIATDFVANQHLENFEAIFISRGDGLGYVNVAPVVEVGGAKVVIYPDIIKVKLNENTGAIVGYEAKSYAFNHTKRTLSTPTLSLSDAQAKVSSRLTINSARLALIPKEYGSETLCYEFECQKEGITFYVFINANTGAEEEIFRVIENSEGKNVI